MATTDKVEAVAEIADRFRTSSAAVITEYTGLTVAQLSRLRRELGGGTKYRIAKNTLVRRAVSDAGVEGLDELFVGPTAIAFVEGEPVEAAKTLKGFAKENRALVIKGGYMDGRPISVAEVDQLAELDSREVLLGKAAGAMKAKLSQTASLLVEPASRIARLAAALQDKQGGAAPAEQAGTGPVETEGAETEGAEAEAAETEQTELEGVETEQS